MKLPRDAKKHFSCWSVIVGSFNAAASTDVQPSVVKESDLYIKKTGDVVSFSPEHRVALTNGYTL